MNKQKKIELLAPAKDKECGIQAILHGADAVYIGAPHHGARAAAGNSIEDIKELVDFAHVYNARIYVTVNTIIYDNELEDTREMIYQLYDAGADAIIVQDMSLLEMQLPPIALHASTQTDNRTLEKVKFLKECGFSQVVLARELSLDEISNISSQCDVPLEVFVHGALCVSYSGQCYVSQACFNRSANRGECAQFCRLPLTLTDATGKVIAQDKHLLSLKDMNRSEYLEKLLDAGATSFKIEGRLKDVDYVKNVTAYYRTKLDEIFAKRTEFCRASSGKTELSFKPELSKSFNRGFTEYFLTGRKSDIASFDTPKSKGQYVGRVGDIQKKFFTINTSLNLHNGDGLCFVNQKGELQGFRINKVEGKNIFPLEMPKLKRNDAIYRNFDIDFNRALSKKSADRKIGLEITMTENNFGFTLSAKDEDGFTASIAFEAQKEKAQSEQRDNIIRQLSKLGNTPFNAQNVTIETGDNYFIPASTLTENRRKLIEAMLSVRKIRYQREMRKPVAYPDMHNRKTTYLDNISNSLAGQFYQKAGVSTVTPAYELSPERNAIVMFCKHCLRKSLGICTKDKVESPYKEPFTLTTQNGKKFTLKFNCSKCEMYVVNNEQ